MVKRSRKPNRLKGYNYSRSNAYFITICVKDRLELLGKIDVMSDTFKGNELCCSTSSQLPRMVLSPNGIIVDRRIKTIRRYYEYISIDNYVIMPNHIHMIVTIHNYSNKQEISKHPANAAIPSLVATIKRFVHKECGFSFFQRSYHDHIIRSEREYERISQYISANPLLWETDCFNETH